MGRQLALSEHCLLCLRELDVNPKTHRPDLNSGSFKQVYERNRLFEGGGGFSPIAKICADCLGYLRGGNWPSDVYAKLWSKELATERALRDAGLPEAPEIAA
jgi:hypothetical protein